MVKKRSDLSIFTIIFSFVFFLVFFTGLAYAEDQLRANVISADRFDVSPPLQSMRPILQSGAGTIREIPRFDPPKGLKGSQAAESLVADPTLQSWHGDILMPSPSQNFEGVSNLYSVYPPDTQGDVGPNHYIQWVNLSFAIWNKSGTLLYGPAAGNTLWANFGGACQTSNDGDPITLYDHLADRWFMSQFALPNFPNGPFYQCIAVSVTGDPTGAWYRYAFPFSKMNDYPKFGVWPDGYYMTINQFNSGSTSWGGAGVAAFERTKMLSGQAATMQYFDLSSVSYDFSSMLPADLDGPAPPAGTPNYFAEVDDSATIGPTDALRIWEFHVDWATPANTTFGISGNPDLVLPVTDYTVLCPSTRNCIPQPGTSQNLDAIGDRLMYRLQYRNFGTHQTMVTNHTVDAGSGQAGIRWYELRKTTGDWNIFQQGTYAPNDGLHRWMGSIAMDASGNIALGYSVSSSTIYPSIRYAGRLVSDTLGQLPQAEEVLIAGSGSQTGTAARWGDYSTMSVDPADQCTFWYTTEYVATTGYATWQTRVGAFKFPSCNSETGLLRGQVTNISDRSPIADAIVTVGTYTTYTDLNGDYAISLAPDTYTVTVSKYGFHEGSAAGVVVTEGNTTRQDFVLTPSTPATVQGTIKDGSGGGWPLFATVTISSGDFNTTLTTDPVTGHYSLQLFQETTYSFEAAASGYDSQTITATVRSGGSTLDFNLNAGASCSAPGYYSNSFGNCVAGVGGLIFGKIYDKNTSLSLSGMTVVLDKTKGSATSDNIGYYTLFATAGKHTVKVAPSAFSGYYTKTKAVKVLVSNEQVVRADLEAPAGHFSVIPNQLTVQVPQNSTKTSATFNLMNIGSSKAPYEIKELKDIVTSNGPFEKPNFVVKPFRQGFSSATALGLPAPPSSPPYAAGDVIQTWPSGLASAWGVVYDNTNGSVWVSSPGSAWGGNDTLYEYNPSGSTNGRSWLHTLPHSNGPADMAFNWNTGTMWVMNINDVANCIYEIDPSTGYTGKSICPGGGTGFAYSQRGLAYDPRTDTWYAGSWNDSMIHHFQSDGTMISSVNVGLAIAGLAYNPDTHHLFVVTNASPNLFYVLDTENNFSVVGQFTVPGFSDYGGAGLEIDCNGRLWAVNQSTETVFLIDSGETTSVCYADIPWFAIKPAKGSVGAGATKKIKVKFNSTGLALGTYEAGILINNITPYGSIKIPVTMEVVAP